MRSKRNRLAAVTLLGGLSTLGIGFAAGPASAAVLSDDCSGFLGQSGSLQLTGNPAGAEVPVGSTITLSGSWNDNDYNETDKFWVCATVDGTFNEAMSSLDRGVANNGSHSASAALPSSVAAGSNVCFVSALRGQSSADRTTLNMVSDELCYRVAAVATTTTTTTVAPAVQAPVVEPTVVEAGNISAPAVEAAPAVEPAPLPVLPRTGGGIELLSGLGGLAVAAGGVASFFGRRR